MNSLWSPQLFPMLSSEPNVTFLGRGEGEVPYGKPMLMGN